MRNRDIGRSDPGIACYSEAGGVGGLPRAPNVVFELGLLNSP